MDEVRALERRLPETAPERPVLFFGSSSIRLWETLPQDFPEVPVANAGFGGSTLAACVYFFERIVLPAAPRSLVFYAGDNDLGDGQMPDAVLASLEALHGKIRDQLGETPFAFLAVKPSLARWELRNHIAAVNNGARALLASRPQSFFVDLSAPMLGNDGMPRRQLFVEDGLHLSPEGYALWTQVVRCFLPRLR